MVFSLHRARFVNISWLHLVSFFLFDHIEQSAFPTPQIIVLPLFAVTSSMSSPTVDLTVALGLIYVCLLSMSSPSLEISAVCLLMASMLTSQIRGFRILQPGCACR